ncbi:hypothetical protein JHD48_00115 [Sulfurimonas sp. SAG-AH-194-I05]|nr:hypothetical protein [Sulfurimonas sp. SAG-AH-194-I05]MDF1874129.1 hypothetical protein [Sulfurimonas sp. SAG-AH-194-I05]
MQVFERNEKIKDISYSFAQDNAISPKHRDVIYNCLGYLIYNAKEDASVQNSLTQCKNDYHSKDTSFTYYNQSWLMRDFSRWDGSYVPLERIIKKHIKEKRSYKFKKVNYKMMFDDTRPHMFVSIDFRAANLGGMMMDRTMSIKVDAQTKELFDLK